MLAHSSQMGALATQVRVESSRFKHMQLVEVRPGLALLVLVLHAGVVKQQMVSLDLGVTQDELSQISNQFNDLLANRTAGEISDWLPDLTPLGRQVLDLVIDTIGREDSPVSEQVFREGLSHVLMQPEFAATEDAHQLVAVLEQASLLSSIFDSVRVNDGVQILIGGDGRYDALRDLSLVLSRYGVDRSVTGVLGIVGPVRMHYGRTIPLVRYVAELMSGLVQEWYT